MDGSVQRNLKVGSLFLKLIIKYCEWFVNNLTGCISSIIDLLIYLYE